MGGLSEFSVAERKRVSNSFTRALGPIKNTVVSERDPLGMTSYHSENYLRHIAIISLRYSLLFPDKIRVQIIQFRIFASYYIAKIEIIYFYLYKIYLGM